MRGSLETSLLLQRSFHGHASSSRRLVESDRTASPNPGVQTSRWKTTPIRSRLPQGRLVRSAKRDPLTDAATGDELWFEDELLAKVARLARGRRLATDPLCFARLASALRADRLVTGNRGRQFRARSFWGEKTGPNPTDRAKLGSKRHLICDGQGIPTRHPTYWSQP